MDTPVQLSILLTNHTGGEHFRSLLTNLLQFNHRKIEIIIINDSADPETSQYIRQEIENSNNEQIFLYEHDAPAGRAASLNEALIYATGRLIWAPLRADSLNESLLNDTIRRFVSDPAAFWTLDFSLPATVFEWITAAEEGELPDDSCLVWNRESIDPAHFYFNPFLNTLHGAELAFRLHGENVWRQTDPFFVVADDQAPLAGENAIQEFLYTALRLSTNPESRSLILKELSEPASLNKKKGEEDYLIQARQLLAQGDANRSLEIVDKFLKRNPGHHEASRIKISSLEKLRRHVEAAELKHDLNKKASGPVIQTELTLEEEKSSSITPANTEISVIIPTTGLGKPLLETTLLQLEKILDPASTELIIIDNASIDDTFDYLNQLTEKNFLNLKIITNPSNRGFGTSVNQGMKAAAGDFFLVMHNDVKISANTPNLLKQALLEHNDVALAAPVIAGSKTDENNSLTVTNRIESCCFMMRGGLPYRFDEQYRLLHFEMDDFCRQITDGGHQIVTVQKTVADHPGSVTSKMMGMELCPELKWKNRARFQNKWGPASKSSLPEQGTPPDRFAQLGAPENPADPNPSWLHTVQNYLTDEVRTEIFRGSWEDHELCTIVSTLLIADERELLRNLEDRLDDKELPVSLLVLLVKYYFDKNIYSRCRHYLEMAGDTHPIFDLYRLKIMVADKELDNAYPLLNKLLDQFPASPDLFYLSGEIYRHNGDEGEAKSFFAMASQLDPFRFRADEQEFEIRL